YSNSQRLKARIEDDNLLQAPLYLLAAERKFGHAAGAMYYVGLKGAVQYEKWETSAGWRERATERTLAVIGEIRGGRVDVAPVDRDDCRFCDSKDICRVETQSAEGRAAAEGA